MRKYIYILIVIVAAIVLWEIFGIKKPAVAPTIATNTTTTEGATGTPPSVQSGYFSQLTTSSLGTYLTDKNGMTLYTFVNDKPDVSNCTGTCLEKWPPYGPGISATGTAPVNLPMLPAFVGVIKGNNGMMQFTWKGMPLYYYFLDKKPGDTFGEGIFDAWYVVNI